MALYTGSMKTTTLQIRNVPVAMKRKLKARAAAEGLSVSAYIRRELEQLLAYPSPEEFLRELRNEPLRVLKPSPTEVLRRERKARGRD